MRQSRRRRRHNDGSSRSLEAHYPAEETAQDTTLLLPRAECSVLGTTKMFGSAGKKLADKVGRHVSWVRRALRLELLVPRSAMYSIEVSVVTITIVEHACTDQ